MRLQNIDEPKKFEGMFKGFWLLGLQGESKQSGNFTVPKP